MNIPPKAERDAIRRLLRRKRVPSRELVYYLLSALDEAEAEIGRLGRDRDNIGLRSSLQAALAALAKLRGDGPAQPLDDERPWEMKK
jgi:hypothetical protein